MSTDAPPAQVPGYRIERFVGAGAFGQIWYAVDINTSRPVAIKFYLHRDGVNWSLLSREVKSLVLMSADRSVVQVLQVGWDAEVPYYIMEWVAGGSLEDYLSNRPPMTPSASLRMLRQILAGLNHCHGKGVLHCDLKPANILLGDDKEPRLTDFGQSRLASDQTPALGTLFYMAPEQAALDAVPDARWDVYAAGAIMYRMLTGSAPHRDRQSIGQIENAATLQSRLAAYRQRIGDSPPSMRPMIAAGADRPLAKIVSRCLHPDPQRRYANVQSITEDLAARDVARARRPLYMIGIVGPILIALLTGLVGYRTVTTARDQTVAALRHEAAKSNAVAAELAARSMELQWSRYFDLVRDEARRATLADRLQTLAADPSMQTLQDELTGQTSAATMNNVKFHRRFLANQSRRRLDEYLSKRLADYTGQPDAPPLATAFVTDARGTILSIAYRQSIADANNSAGRNFAYRTYFHGGKADLPAQSVGVGTVPPLTQTHLSAPFQSTATGLWKVAVSTPVRTDSDGDIVAVLVVTINLGELRLLRAADEKQFTVVIDARPGKTRGTILQHPAMADAGRRDPAAGNYQIATATLQKLLRGDDETYRDPISNVAVQTSGGSIRGDDPNQEDNAWIAAVSPVSLPRPTGSSAGESDPDAGGDSRAFAPERSADLMVLVQYKLASVLRPVRQLSRSLLIEGLLGLMSVGVVSSLVWWLAQRISSDAVRGRKRQPRSSKLRSDRRASDQRTADV